MSHDDFEFKAQPRPVGISEKGWVIVYGGDWYLYLSLYTQPNIK